MRSRLALAASLVVCAASSASAQQRADAVLIVNSASPGYADSQRLIRPYLDHFGVPYTVLDIATTSVGPDIGKYALIIIGHVGLDTTGQYLGAVAQSSISSAVSQGTGLVNFDYDLAASRTSPRYSYVQDLFGFGYAWATSGEVVVFGSQAPGHFITSRHPAGQVIGARQMPSASLVPPTSASVLARFLDSGEPFLVTAPYGLGRAVQFASYQWMQGAISGALRGLDDLVWRSLAWAARKPFVMRGLPNFLTVRVDDALGGFGWVRVANEFQLKPWLGLFYGGISEANAADLAALVGAGQATASVHSLYPPFFYYDHFARQNFPDATMSASYQDATAWHTARGIPMSTFMVPHFYEIGSNAFAGLQAWGVRSLATHMSPGQPYGSAWLGLGPFRLYEAGLSDDARPVAYADYLSIPGHPELANRFFVCATEIRDDAGYEWYPDATDVAGTVGRGIRQTKRAFDAMALATLFTHEYFLQSFTQADWRASLRGIVDGVASYSPIPVTMDYACEYLRAKHDSRITASVYDPANQTLTTDFGGSAEIATQFLVFTEASGFVGQAWSGVPAFSGTTRVTQSVAPGQTPTLTSIAMTPANPTITVGATQQFTATGSYSDGSLQVLTSQVTWATGAAGVATIGSTGLATGAAAGSTSVSAALGSVVGTTTLTVQPATLAITTASLPSVPLNVTYAASVSASGGSPPYAWALSSGALPPGLVLSPAGIISGTPTTVGSYTFTVGVTDSAAASASAPLTIVVLSQSGLTIWPATATPATPDRGPDAAIELGVKFRSDVSGFVTGIRFYKSAANTGTHIGNLWSSNGVRLASATFTGETASGWQQVDFATPVAVDANTTYVASYHAPAGHYARDLNYFATSGYDAAPLHAFASGVSGGNGVFAYGPSSFPTDVALSANYWVDVVFSSGSPPPTLTSIAVTPANPSASAGSTLQLTAIGSYSDGSTRDVTGQVAWASSSPAVATVGATGVVTAVAAGTTTLSATAGGLSGSTSLTVTPGVASIIVTPASAALVPGQGQQFNATAYDAAANPLSGISFTWTTTGGGSITAGGLFTAGATAGTFPNNVVATSAGVSGTASTEVVGLASIALDAADVVEGVGVTGTVTLSGPAPAAGALVALSSSSAAASVPASVTVAGGATSATFAVTTSAVTVTTAATITAALGSASRSAALSVRALTMTISPASVQGGGGATGTLTLSAAPSAPVAVTLSSSSAAATVPASAVIAAGATSTIFAIATAAVAASTGVTLTASVGTVPHTASLTVNPAALTSLVLSPTAVAEGGPSIGTVTLSGPAPAAGATVTLASSSTAAVVPASVTVAGGATTASFTVTTGAVSAGTTATLTATYAGTARTATLSIRAATLTLSPTTVGGGNGSTATLRLSASLPAPLTATLSTSNAAVATVPPTVTILAGATTATFPVSTFSVIATTSATLTATYAGIPASATLSVRVIQPSAVSLNPNNLVGGAPSTGTVTLNYAAPAGGYLVAFASSRTAVAQVPASVTVPAGSTTVTFPISTSAVTANTSSTISASGGGVTRTTTLTVTAAAAARSLTLAPTTVARNGTSSGTVTLNGPAPAAGTTVTLTSNNVAAATVPPSLVVPAGALSATFAVTAGTVAANTAVTISAAAGGRTATASLTVTP